MKRSHDGVVFSVPEVVSRLTGLCNVPEGSEKIVAELKCHSKRGRPATKRFHCRLVGVCKDSPELGGTTRRVAPRLQVVHALDVGVGHEIELLPGEVLEGRVREVGYGVAVDTAPLGSLPTVENDSNWLRDAQRYPVLIDFELPEGQVPLKVGSQATVAVYTGDHFVVNPLARVYLWLLSILTYAY